MYKQKKIIASAVYEISKWVLIKAQRGVFLDL